MEKFKNALKSVNKLGLLAIVLVAFATMAFTPSKNLTTKRWGYNPSAPLGQRYIDVTNLMEQTPGHPGQYVCNTSDEICTYEYDASVDPNSSVPSSPISTKAGDFELVDQ